MRIQTIFRAGNSDVVALPQAYAKRAGFSVGQKVSVEQTENGAIIIRSYKEAPKAKATTMQKEFDSWMEQFIDENGGILDELAVR
jgi:antitoxin component of MazEF toxin-antitoxin module